LIDRLESISRHYAELESELSRPEVVADHEKVTKLARELAGMRDIVEAYREYREAEKAHQEARDLLHAEKDPEMQEYLRSEEAAAATRIEELNEKLKVLLLPKDPNDDRDVIVEIQGAEGGDEAELFARDLFELYTKFAANKGWKVDIIDAQESGIGGFSKIEFEVKGKGAYSQLKFEGGVHRVQRVPKTESQGRIHTSAATVAVMPEADAVEIDLPEKDIKVETSTSTGPGGQSVNTTYSAIRITHLPTGTVVSIQDEKSQLKNRDKAMKVLRARLYERKLAEQHAEQDAQRRTMVRTGNRSEKIRTYNFKENRVTDHRIDLTLYKLDRVMQGELDEIVDALISAERAAQLGGGNGAGHGGA
jgi:peptide chain release factor 1